MGKLKDEFECEICGQKVTRTVFCKRLALMCPNCMAKYDNTGKRDKRFNPLPKESWMPNLMKVETHG